VELRQAQRGHPTEVSFQMKGGLGARSLIPSLIGPGGELRNKKRLLVFTCRRRVFLVAGGPATWRWKRGGTAERRRVRENRGKEGAKTENGILVESGLRAIGIQGKPQKNNKKQHQRELGKAFLKMVEGKNGQGKRHVNLAAQDLLGRGERRREVRRRREKGWGRIPTVLRRERKTGGETQNVQEGV